MSAASPTKPVESAEKPEVSIEAAETAKSSPSKVTSEILSEAMHKLSSGKRNLLVNDIPAAVTALAESCQLLGQHFGETAVECGEAYFYYGKGLLELARLENGVLENVMDGVPEGEDSDNSQVEDPDKCTGDEKDEVSNQVGEAIEENFKALEKSKTKKEDQGKENVILVENGSAKESVKPESDLKKPMNEVDGNVPVKSSKVEEVKNEIHEGSQKDERKPPKNDETVGERKICKKDEHFDSVESEKDVEAAKSTAIENPDQVKKESSDEMETEKPLSDSKEPSSDTQKPSTDTEKPSTDTEKPSTDTEKPSTDTEKPSTDTEKPSTDTEKPSTDTEKPSTDTEKPSSETEKRGKDESENGSTEDEEAEVPTVGKTEDSDDKDIDKQEKGEEQDDDDEDEEEDGETSQDEEPAKETDGNESIGSNDAGTSDAKEACDKSAVENEDEEDPSNLQLAWEMLELAKMCFQKHADSLGDVDPKRMEMENRLCETYQILGELSVENENYPQAIEDLTSCLRRRQELMPADSRSIAETHYQMGVALGYNLEFDKAVESLKDAIAVLLKRIDNLKNKTESEDPLSKKDAFYTREKEITEIESLIPEIKEKITDTKDMQQETVRKLGDRALLEERELEASSGPQVNGDVITTNGFDAPPPTVAKTSTEAKPTSDISHMIKKRKKSEPTDEVPVTKKVHVESNGSSNGASSSSNQAEMNGSGDCQAKP
ncbi:hypothetical protein TCAL_11416 [Tigriopus californicus]|uniref:Tetratricopeptide SHNi-TPR domain-containing protein n=1 Tax=Tigriopus californicus TaxID=6832 RepID=A0A553NZK1_TIGCA|nr:protein HGV2-like [Tigriopus californicus]TRY70866.1 hypothetical protein TCAL_11416 [Tigriopus californicus]